MTDIRTANALQGTGAVVVSQGILRMESSQNWTGTYTVSTAAPRWTVDHRDFRGQRQTSMAGTLQNVSGVRQPWMEQSRYRTIPS